MADYMYSDEQYDYYGSQMNKPFQNRTLIIARDSNGKITFRHESKGKLTNHIIKGILKAWCVNEEKEKVEIQYI
jgi:hypothetical protein